MKKFNLLILTTILLILFAGCSSSVSSVFGGYEFFYMPPDLLQDSLRQQTIDTYAEGLNGKIIFIDPGHGGADRKNMSPNGDVVEADVNLHVALKLREFLHQAGAIVYLSRETDATVDLKMRSEILNESDAEIFVSIHHNAPGNSNSYWVDYTSTYYHASETDYEYEPSSRDIARYVQRDLAFAMHNSGGLGSFDGTYSDYIIYPGDGFSVLRLAQTPAILIECAFHTNPMEEIRLADEGFNRLQAWAIFKGLGKYYYYPAPAIELMEDESKLDNNSLDLSVKLIDENGIEEKSISAFMNKEKVDFEYDVNSQTVNLVIENIESGEHTLRLVCKNNKGRYSFPYHKKIIIE